MESMFHGCELHHVQCLVLVTASVSTLNQDCSAA